MPIWAGLKKRIDRSKDGSCVRSRKCGLDSADTPQVIEMAGLNTSG